MPRLAHRHARRVLSSRFAQRCNPRRMGQDVFMATSEVAEQLGVSIATVNRMAKDGRLTPALKMPGRTGAFVFLRAQVEGAAADTKEAAS
jgi:excisionase family DNA binding protein